MQHDEDTDVEDDAVDSDHVLSSLCVYCIWHWCKTFIIYPPLHESRNVALRNAFIANTIPS